MFRQLNDLRLQRTVPQAILFYFVYLFAGLLLSALFGAASVVAGGSRGFDDGLAVGLNVGVIFALFFAGIFSLAILRAKRQLGHVSYVVVGVASVAASAVGGLLLGLLFVAFLTTRPANQTVDVTARPVERSAAL